MTYSPPRLPLDGTLVATPPLLWVVGRYISPQLMGSSTTQALSASRLYLVPMYFPVPRTIDRIGINITTAGTAGNVARLGIWNADPVTNLPSTVLLDAGTVSVATPTGAKEATVSQVLSGLVWLGVTGQSGTASAVSTAMVPNIVGNSTLSVGANVSVGVDTIDPTVALPTMVGVTLSYGITTTPPAVLLRSA